MKNTHRLNHKHRTSNIHPHDYMVFILKFVCFKYTKIDTYFFPKCMIMRMLGKLVLKRIRAQGVVFPEFVFSINRSFPPVKCLVSSQKEEKLFSLTVDLVLLLPKDTGSQNSLH